MPTMPELCTAVALAVIAAAVVEKLRARKRRRLRISIEIYEYGRAGLCEPGGLPIAYDGSRFRERGENAIGEYEAGAPPFADDESANDVFGEELRWRSRTAAVRHGSRRKPPASAWTSEKDSC